MGSLAILPWTADAASLGRLTVFSGLGQALRAELDITANREELAGMSARLATADIFSQSGVDYAPALRNLRFTIDKRADGRPVVRVTSTTPINEPFLDFLVELNWPTGRLVREYTFLLDPPELVAKSAQSAVADSKPVAVERRAERSSEAPATKLRQETREPVRPQSEVAPAPAEPADSFAEAAVTPKRQPPKAARPVPEAPAPVESSQIRVKSGDTLHKIAVANQYDDVSLEQMLVALYRNNPSAFMGRNINRLRSGAILGLPEKAEVEAIPENEARKVFQAQSADWQAYRRKLAAATAGAGPAAEQGTQSATGKITAKVEDKLPAAEQGKDQVKVSRTESAKSGDKSESAAEVDKIASERALKEAQERVAQLEKNVGDLQKLLELKNEKLAELESLRKAEAKPAEPEKPAVEAAEKAPAPEADKPALAEKPAETAAPVEAKPLKKLDDEAEEEPEEEGLVDSLLKNPLLLGAGGLLAAALLALGLFRRRRAAAKDSVLDGATSTLAGNSEFRSTGGQSVDTGNPAATAEFSQAGPGAIDTDDVDPVAEADVYMAYGRDNQAEEILLEALQKDPQRTAIHVKLLEIYAGRQSVKPFENIAGELFALTGGLGSDWAKAVELGAAIDPENPLYSKHQSFSPAPSAEAEPEAAMPESAPTPVDELPVAESLAAEAPPAHLIDTQSLGQQHVESVTAGGNLQDLDFEVPLEPAAAELPPMEVAAAEPEPELEPEPVDALDFDMPPPPDAEVASNESIDDFEFELPAQVSEPAPAPDSPSDALNFETAPEPEILESQAALELAAKLAEAAKAAVPTTTALPPEAYEAQAELVDADADADADADSVPMPELDVAAAIDFDLDLANDDGQPVPPLDLPPPSVAAGSADGSAPAQTALPDNLQFEVELSDSVVLGGEADKTELELADIDLELASLDLATPQPSAVAVQAEAPAPVVHDAQWEEVNTKLDLAKAYEEMGDLDGARELLQEVATEGAPDLVSQARAILDRIGG